MNHPGWRPQRRQFLGMLATGAGAFLPGFAAAVNPILDVHAHFSPPGWVAELARTNQLIAATRDWTPARAVEDMDQGGITAAITSITTPAFLGMDRDTGRRYAREANDYAARLISDHKGRFGMFTSVPLQDIDGTLREIEYGLDNLKADGVALLTNVGDKWISDPTFAPVWDELNRRKAVVYTHPTIASCCRNLIAGIPDTVIEYGTDTTRVIAQWVFSGASQKYRDVRVIFSHAGGVMPYLMERFNFLTRTQYAKQLPGGFSAEASRFYYDTAQAFSAPAMSALRKAVPLSQIVFGSDYPFRTSAEHTKGLKECGIYSARELRAIEHDNPARLLPRFRT